MWVSQFKQATVQDISSQRSEASANISKLVPSSLRQSTAKTCWTSSSSPRSKASIWSPKMSLSTAKCPQAASPSPGKTRWVTEEESKSTCPLEISQRQGVSHPADDRDRLLRRVERLLSGWDGSAWPGLERAAFAAAEAGPPTAPVWTAGQWTRRHRQLTHVDTASF